MNVLGYSDQRYILAAGSQALPEAIAAWLPPGSIRFNRRLLAIRRAGGSYELRFGGATSETVYADRVVLAIPFIALRAVDYSGAGFDSAKKNAIENLGYGYHTKLHLQFDRRAWMRSTHPWPEPTTGQIWTTLPVQSALDYSLGQRGRQRPHRGLHRGQSRDARHAADAVRRRRRGGGGGAARAAVLRQLDRIWPGVSSAWNGKATFGNAQADPNIRASYSCWLVGQCTTIAGHEASVQGRVHFAGEHTSVAYQGFMEGGAESGFRAADEILAEYGIRTKRPDKPPCTSSGRPGTSITESRR